MSSKNKALEEYNIFEDIIVTLENVESKYIALTSKSSSDVFDILNYNRDLIKSIRLKAERLKCSQIYVCVCGEVNSGKSTFINALLKEYLLPTSPLQCTRMGIEIKYGESIKIRTHCANGSVMIMEVSSVWEVRNFINAYASLYSVQREIPVSLIERLLFSEYSKKNYNSNLSENEISNFLSREDVIKANIYGMPKDKYENKIRDYIEEYKNNPHPIISKIVVEFPFKQKYLKNIVITDTPGIGALGGLSYCTYEYMKQSDAILFLKPLVGQALEADGFWELLQKADASRRKKALFLILTHSCDTNKSDLRGLLYEARLQFGEFFQDNILPVDSEIRLAKSSFEKSDDIRELKKQMVHEEQMLPSVSSAYEEYYISCDDDRESFLNELDKLSGFKEVEVALEEFCDNAEKILSCELINSIREFKKNLLAYIDEAENLIENKKQPPKNETEILIKYALLEETREIIQSSFSL